MTSPSHMNVNGSRSKTEFSKLYELFDALATRRSQAATEGSDTTVAEDSKSMSIPPELSHVFSSLSALVISRNGGQRKGRPRRNTVGIQPKSAEGNESLEDEESSEKFPFDKQYPFTFRLMLHKLYELEDWASKVKDALAMSQETYKPLAETRTFRPQNGSSGVTGVPAQTSSNHASSTAVQPTQRKGSVPDLRERRQSIIWVPTPNHGDIHFPNTVDETRTSEQEHGHAYKRRCVGRRVSVSGAETVGELVYDVAKTYVGRSPSNRDQQGALFVRDKPRNRHQSVKANVTRTAKGSARRRINSVTTSRAVQAPSRRLKNVSIHDEPRVETGKRVRE